jgi:hypothetical protein
VRRESNLLGNTLNHHSAQHRQNHTVRSAPTMRFAHDVPLQEACEGSSQGLLSVLF